MKKRMLTASLAVVCLTGEAWAFPWYASGDGIWGAELMTREERLDYVGQVREMKSYDECKAFIDAHRLKLQQRAHERNMSLPAPPSTNPCDVMERMGRFSGGTPACPTSK